MSIQLSNSPIHNIDNSKIVNWPKVSVVIPSFNQGEFIESTLLSIVDQGYPNLELIIIDGGSTDNTVEIIRKYEEHISYWESKKDNGQSQALNDGFDKATGDIYCWMNSDDTFAPNAIEKSIKTFLAHPEVNIVFGDYLEIDEHDNFLNYNYAFDFSVNHFIYEGFHLNAQSMFWRKEVHRRFGQFDEKLHRTMDYDMILRFGINEGISAFHRIENVPLGCFRRHENQKTTPKGQETVNSEHRYIAEKLGINDKYNYTGKIKRIYFRFRRLLWYIKRGGLNFAFKKLTG